jgi:hypothetical protein
VTEEEQLARRRERFGITPDNTERFGPDGKPKPWVVPAIDYPAQPDGLGGTIPRNPDVKVDPTLK